MGDKKILILDKTRIEHKLQRMAYQIWEHNSSEQRVVLAGIHGGGTAVAENLAERLRTISGMEVEVISIKMNKRKPLSEEVVMEQPGDDRPVVVVDDVANSGKTLMYALKPLLNYEPKKIMIAVLVDRKHKEFPVSPDIVGHSIATTIKEHIEVEVVGKEIEGAYLV